VLSQKIKLLVFRWTDGNNHPSALLQLADERLRDLIRSAGDDNAIEWRVLRPTLVAIAREHFYIDVAESFQIRFGSPGQRLNDLDRVNLRNEAGEDCAW